MYLPTHRLKRLPISQVGTSDVKAHGLLLAPGRPSCNHNKVRSDLVHTRMFQEGDTCRATSPTWGGIFACEHISGHPPTAGLQNAANSEPVEYHDWLLLYGCISSFINKMPTANWLTMTTSMEVFCSKPAIPYHTLLTMTKSIEVVRSQPAIPYRI